MKSRPVLLLALAFVASFFAVGWPYWQVLYAQVSLPGTLVGAGLFVVAGAAAAAVVARVAALPVFAVVGAAPAASVLARIVYDTTLDPTSHNLWPFEVVLAGMLGYAVALVGIVLGLLLTRLLRKSGTRA